MRNGINCRAKYKTLRSGNTSQTGMVVITSAGGCPKCARCEGEAYDED